MKIIVANTYIPFVYGGSEILAENLTLKLNEFGHNARLINIPFNIKNEKDILENMLANRLLYFDNADKLICLRFPVYSINHPNKSIWLFHQFRQVYDLWGTRFIEYKQKPEDVVFKNIVENFDNQTIKESRKIYTISKNVTRRLKEYNHIKSEVLYPPLLNENKYICNTFGDYIYYPSRITSLKRQLLAVKSFRYVKSKVKLIISGRSEDSHYLDQIKDFIKTNSLADRITIIDEWINEEKKYQFFANSLAVIFVPYDEDFGFITTESFSSKKPIITCSDSGGTLELVKNNFNGFITEPDPKEMAEAIDKLYYDKKLARKMGENGFETIKNKKINWDNVINKLTL